MTSELLPPPRDDGSHLGCCRVEPQVSVTPTVLSACDIPKWLGPAGLAKNAARTKINLPHSLAAPCPFPLSSHPSSQHSPPGKAKRGTVGWRKQVLLPSNSEKERERGREEEKDRERDHLIWERAQTMCGNGLEGSGGQIPDRWKKLSMGQSVFLGPENSSCFTLSSHKAWPVFLSCLSRARWESYTPRDLEPGPGLAEGLIL